MTGSTRTCIALLNAFSLVCCLGGVALIALALDSASAKSTTELVWDVGAGISAVLSATLLRAASEGLRLLSSIHERLAASPQAQARSSTKVVQRHVA